MDRTRQVLLLLVAAAMVALWLASAPRTQPTVGPNEQTVVAQMTVIAGPAPTQETK